MSGAIPTDIFLMKQMLENIGLTSDQYDPEILNQMLEFSSRYASDALNKADIVRTTINAECIERKHLRIVFDAKTETTFDDQFKKFAELAHRVNSQSIAPVPTRAGLVLPPDASTFSSPDYNLSLVPHF